VGILAASGELEVDEVSGRQAADAEAGTAELRQVFVRRDCLQLPATSCETTKPELTTNGHEWTRVFATKARKERKKLEPLIIANLTLMLGSFT